MEKWSEVRRRVLTGELSKRAACQEYGINWQLIYRLHEPLPLAAGDRLVFTAWYDNSVGNPANPDPSKTIRWGPQTFDEMHLGYVEYFVPGVAPGERPLLRRSEPVRRRINRGD